MSWLTDLIRGKATLAQVLAKSAIKLQKLTGVQLTDAQADEVTNAVDRATDAAEAAFKSLVASKFPALPAAVATIAVHAALNVIDAAAAGAMNVVKGNN